MDASEHFNDPAVSDVVLHVVSEGDVSRRGGSKTGRKRGASPEPARSYFCSRLALCQADFFKALILRWTPDQAACSAKAKKRKGPQSTADDGAPGCMGRMELQHSVAEGELEAFELLLRLMYGAAMPEAAAGDAMLLVKAYAAADMYGVPRCAEVLAAALCSLSTEGLDLDLVKALYSLPESRTHLAPLLVKCQQRMVQMFGDVPSVITSDQLRQQFCSLPFAAVLAWLKADDLKVHSENCVVFLLSTWVASEDHAACPAAQLEELACHVRVLHVSPLYLQCVLPSLAWFSSQAKHLSYLVVQRLSGEADASSFWKGPPTWQAGPRKETGLPNSLALDWEVGGAQLEELYSGKDIHSPEPLYVNGVYCRLLAQRVVVAGQKPERFTLGLYLVHLHPLMRAVLASDVAFAKASIKYQCKLQVKEPVSGAWKGFLLYKVAELAVALGYPDLLGCSGSTMQEALASFLVEGKLSVRATDLRLG